MDRELTILYEDASLIVCVKPAGIASQGGGWLREDLSDRLRLHIRDKDKTAGEPYLGIVHRLDQPVGGVMVYAKEPGSAANLSAQVVSGEMKKRYYAVLEGKPEKDAGVLRDYLLKDKRTNLSRVVPEARKGEKDVKPAELSYQIVKELKKDNSALFLVEIELKTGRHHQIRVQFSHAGCPLYGDRKYNPTSVGREMALFSHYLAFTHPVKKGRMEFDQTPENGIFSSFFCV